MHQNEKHAGSLKIATIDALAHRLGVSPEVLAETAEYAGRYYDPYTSTTKPPPFPKNPTHLKKRRIDKPTAFLKDIQRRINQRLLRNLKMPSHICGSVAGKTLVNNIAPHLGASVIVTLDIKSFFPHITTFQVHDVWLRQLGCTPQVAALLTRLTTFERHLPQGAPTSSALANLVLLSLDEPIRIFCEQNGISYTNWIDDLVFSGEDSRQVIDVAVHALRVGGFSVPHKKLKIMSGSERKLVTGVVVGNKPGILRKYVRDTRSGIHKLNMGLVPHFQIDAYLRKIRGRIAHINRLNPNRARELEHQLASVHI